MNKSLSLLRKQVDIWRHFDKTYQFCLLITFSPSLIEAKRCIFILYFFIYSGYRFSTATIRHCIGFNFLSLVIVVKELLNHDFNIVMSPYTYYFFVWDLVKYLTSTFEKHQNRRL